MAEHFLASIYGTGRGGATAIGTSAGLPYSFPSAGTLFRPTDEVFNGVTTAAIIEVLPTGLKVQSQTFYTAKTVTELDTLANT